MYDISYSECQKADWQKGHKKTCGTVKLSEESKSKSKSAPTSSSSLAEDELPIPLAYPFKRTPELFTTKPSAALLRQIDYLESHPKVDYALFLPDNEILDVVFKEDRCHINSQLRNNAFSGNYFYNLDEHTRFTLMKEVHHVQGSSEARQVQAAKDGVEGLLAWGIAASEIATRKYGNRMASYAAVGDQMFREFGNLQLRAAKAMTPKMWDVGLEMMASGIEEGWEEDKVLRKKWGMEKSV